MLLLHGGWGGARKHCSQVQEALAERFFVIASDLPGLGWLEQPALPTVQAYVRWLVVLLDALGVERAVCVGNYVPPELTRNLGESAELMARNFVRVAIAGDGAPPPRVAPLLLWGECDRLRQSRPRVARRVHASLPGSTFAHVAERGAFPPVGNARRVRQGSARGNVVEAGLGGRGKVVEAGPKLAQSAANFAERVVR